MPVFTRCTAAATSSHCVYPHCVVIVTLSLELVLLYAERGGFHYTVGKGLGRVPSEGGLGKRIMGFLGGGASLAAMFS